MSEKSETVHVVMRRSDRPGQPFGTAVPVRVSDDRADARAYAKRMEDRSKVYAYSVVSCRKL